MKPDLVEAARGSEVYGGTGNIFFDVGLPDADISTTKLRLAAAINNILTERKLTQRDASAVLRVTKPKVSALQNYKLDQFSLMHLMGFAIALDYDVVINFRPIAGAERKGRVTFVAAASGPWDSSCHESIVHSGG